MGEFPTKNPQPFRLGVVVGGERRSYRSLSKWISSLGLSRNTWQAVVRMMVLEAATNSGAAAIVTFNQRDFLPAATTFGLRVITPGDFLPSIRGKLK